VEWKDKVGTSPSYECGCFIRLMWLHPLFILRYLTYADLVGIHLREVVELVENFHVTIWD
jgi:hypothetical protein